VATAIVRWGLLSATVALFVALAARGGGRPVLFVGAVFLCGAVVVLAILETLIRRNAVELLARELGLVALVVVALLALETATAFVLWGSAAAALAGAESPTGRLIALGILAVAGGFWTLIHSYLMAARYAAIDTMRQHVSGH
jgi:hypothetical protein